MLMKPTHADLYCMNLSRIKKYLNYINPISRWVRKLMQVIWWNHETSLVSVCRAFLSAIFLFRCPMTSKNVNIGIILQTVWDYAKENNLLLFQVMYVMLKLKSHGYVCNVNVEVPWPSHPPEVSYKFSQTIIYNMHLHMGDTFCRNVKFYDIYHISRNYINLFLLFINLFSFVWLFVCKFN